MHSIKDLANNLGYTKDEVRNRLDQLRPTLGGHVRRGKRNKILLNDTGFQILERAKELEKQGIALNELPRILDEELSNKSNQKPQENGKTTLAQGELIKEKDQRIKDLKNRVQYLQAKLDERDRQIQQLLPGKVERKNPLTRFIDWLL